LAYQVKAAEGRRSPKRWRDDLGSPVREASWSASSRLALFPVNHPYANINVICHSQSLVPFKAQSRQKPQQSRQIKVFKAGARARFVE